MNPSIADSGGTRVPHRGRQRDRKLKGGEQDVVHVEGTANLSPQAGGSGGTG